MNRRLFAQKSAAALAAAAAAISTIWTFRPAKPPDHLYTCFVMPEDRSNIGFEYYEPCLIALDRKRAFPAGSLGRTRKAMAEQPAGEIWLSPMVVVGWGEHFSPTLMGLVGFVHAKYYA